MPGPKVKYYWIAPRAQLERQGDGRRVSQEERDRLLAQDKMMADTLTAEVQEKFPEVSVIGSFFASIHVMVPESVAALRLAELRELFPDCQIEEFRPWQRTSLPKPPKDPDEEGPWLIPSFWVED